MMPFLNNKSTRGISISPYRILNRIEISTFHCIKNLLYFSFLNAGLSCANTVIIGHIRDCISINHPF